MFNNFTIKSFMVAMLALTLSACASFSDNRYASPMMVRSVVVIPTTAAETPTTIAELPKTEIAQTAPVEFITPIPEVKEITIPEPKKSRFFSDRAHVVMSDAEIRCMANAIYYEARGETTLGKIAVGYVVLTRMGSPQFKPKTACGIVYQQNRRGCQFSWVCDGKPDRIRNHETYAAARQIAIDVMTRSVPNPVGNSIYFRTRSAKSRYAASQRLVASIGQHRFFVEL